MRVRRFRRRFGAVAGLVLAAFVAGLAPAAGQGAQPAGAPSVTGAVQVTRNPDPNRGHTTPQIAVNPKTGELVIGEGEVRTTRKCSVHISVDGGRSWFEGGDPMVKPFTDCTQQATNGHYITFQFTPDGVLWAGFMGDDPASTLTLARADRPRNIYLARSENSGRTWRTTLAYEGKAGDPGIGSSRRAMVAVDPSNPQHVYLGWQKGGAGSAPTGVKRKAMIQASNDGGRTFGEPIDLSMDVGASQPKPVVDMNGVVHVTYANDQFGVPAQNPPGRTLWYQRSSDNGRTWSPRVELDPGTPGFSFMRKQAIAADINTGAVYVTWYGASVAAPRRPPAGQPSTAEFDDREIFVRSSLDGGNTWLPSKIVNDDAERRNIQHYDSGISVAPNGRLDVAWYDFRNSPVPEREESGGNGGGATDVYYAYSTDGGRTYSTNVKVSDRLADRSIGLWSNNVHSHTNVAIASTDTAVYIAWQDTRNGSPTFQAEDIYFAAVRFPVPAEEDEGVPGWVLVGAAAAIGAGVTIVLGFLLNRRRTA
ncbi:MAG: sialidase family protein [Acidimicrobiales bacterium]